MINFGSIAKQVTVSGTAKEPRAVATPQATSQQLPAEPSTGKDPTNSMVATHLFDMMEKQAKALDTLSQKILNNDSLEKLASNNSLSLLSDGCFASTCTFWLCCTCWRKWWHPGKSLEDYVADAKHMLTKRKANELDTAMKRPASKKSLAKAEPKQKAIVKRNAGEAKHVTPAFLKGIYGCVRCRGSVSGCDKSQSPYFGGGLSLTSRQEYNKWYQEKQQGNKRKWKHFLGLTKDREVPFGK